MRVILVGHVGMGNLGDELLVASALRYIGSRHPDLPIRALTMDPADTLRRHGVEAHTLRPQHPAEVPIEFRSKLVRAAAALWRRARRVVRELGFTLRSARRLRRGDLLIVTGSSQFIEAYGGAWGFPLTLLRWTVLARLRGARIAFVSMGAEDVAGPWSRRMIRYTCALANYISVRDEVSKRRLRAIGVTREIPLVPDLVLGLGATVSGTPPPDGRTVAINLVPFFSTRYWRTSDPVRWEAYISAAVGLVEHVIDQGLNVVFFGTHEWSDRLATDEVVSRLNARSGGATAGRMHQSVVKTFEELWAVLHEADWVIASRYHGVVTSLVARRPVLALCYEQKTADVMRMAGVGTYAIDLHEMTSEQLIRMFDSLRRDGEFTSAIDHGVRDAAGAVARQYDLVLAGHGE